ncbi:protein-L-isoaspartate(D-aspartate) O-methyltransferase [Methylocaldum sp.]|uniref:protein-L-isoaspartate(D-aspartate) O-methyltransferase n=1 Tax=Methylocaldum sp. TaxID=1969727 RepID=UPI002D4EFDF0|nr:protein-L-isoaspartate(D-aspartate) O-methyltransferase [Methylocaldum sp.]HYE36958.1 protein-L-isoaspartate(D-aspartate) O-methyltransferase [Methylocaldum sp.]
MIASIEAEARATASYTGRSRFSPAVMSALAKVPRHLFVPHERQDEAYVNAPLSIGWGQTISEPYIVALMTDLLELDARSNVLEIGCGSGYQVAVLSLLARQVYSVEVVEELADAAREKLQRLGYPNVEVITGDGYHGCPEHAPFDGIIVTAAAPKVPPPLLDQLKPGGRMVIPVGLPFRDQELKLLTKGEDGIIDSRSVLPVAFVPFRHSE